MTVLAVSRTGGGARRLHGVDRVAALLLAMGSPAAGRVLKHMDPFELRQVTKATASLGSVPASTIEQLVEEFAGHFTGGPDLLGAPNEAEQLLAGALPPEQVADILSDVLGSANHSMWDKLSNLPDAALNEYLAGEHPQMAAYVLSKINSSTAARLFLTMQRKQRNDLLRRMLGAGPITDAARRVVETTLNDDLLASAQRKAGAGVHARLADIINRFERDDVDDTIGVLAETRPKEAAILKNLLFQFEDVPTLSLRARAILFDKVPTERVIMALRGMPGEFRDTVLTSLASRARRMVEAELDSGAAVAAKDVAKARREIADTVLQLAARNEIELRSEEGGEAA